MSLYNMLFGSNPMGVALLEILGLTREAVGRYRDCFLIEEGGEWRIAVYTRNGGGNRNHCADVESGPACSCTGCVINHRLPAHPQYLSDRDDDFDCTYATVYFKVPESAKELVAAIAAAGQGGNPDPGERFRLLIAKLSDPSKQADPEVQRSLAVGRSIFAAIDSAGKSGEPVTAEHGEGSVVVVGFPGSKT
jgi:hypothetical protein